MTIRKEKLNILHQTRLNINHMLNIILCNLYLSGTKRYRYFYRQ